MLKPTIAFSVLVLFWWIGTWLSPFLPIPFPAPLIGLVLLFVCLVILGKVPDSLLKTSQFLLRHLSVFFIPAILSVVLLQDLLVEHFWAISAALVVSTLFSLCVTAWACKTLGKAH